MMDLLYMKANAELFALLYTDPSTRYTFSNCSNSYVVSIYLRKRNERVCLTFKLAIVYPYLHINERKTSPSESSEILFSTHDRVFYE